MSEHITHPAAVRRLERPASDRRIAGVAGGLGRYFDLNPSFFRIGFVVLTLLGGAGLLIYLTAAFVMPDEGTERSFAEQILADCVTLSVNEAYTETDLEESTDAFRRVVAWFHSRG